MEVVPKFSLSRKGDWSKNFLLYKSRSDETSTSNLLASAKAKDEDGQPRIAEQIHDPPPTPVCIPVLGREETRQSVPEINRRKQHDHQCEQEVRHGKAKIAEQAKLVVENRVVGRGGDDTLFALEAGTVEFGTRRGRNVVNIVAGE